MLFDSVSSHQRFTIVTNLTIVDVTILSSLAAWQELFVLLQNCSVVTKIRELLNRLCCYLNKQVRIRFLNMLLERFLWILLRGLNITFISHRLSSIDLLGLLMSLFCPWFLHLSRIFARSFINNVINSFHLFVHLNTVFSGELQEWIKGWLIAQFFMQFFTNYVILSNNPLVVAQVFLHLITNFLQV